MSYPLDNLIERWGAYKTAEYIRSRNNIANYASCVVNDFEKAIDPTYTPSGFTTYTVQRATSTTSNPNPRYVENTIYHIIIVTYTGPRVTLPDGTQGARLGVAVPNLDGTLANIYIAAPENGYDPTDASYQWSEADRNWTSKDKWITRWGMTNQKINLVFDVTQSCTRYARLKFIYNGNVFYVRHALQFTISFTD